MTCTPRIFHCASGPFFLVLCFPPPPRCGAKNIARPRRRSLMKPGPFFLKKKKSYVLRPQSAGFIRSPEDLSVGPSVINRSSPESRVRRIYPEFGGFIRRTMHMKGSRTIHMEVGPSVINRSSPQDLSVVRRTFRN